MRHEAVVIDGDETFVARLAPFFRAGLAEGPTVAVLNRHHWGLLREELGPDAEQVDYTDCDDFYIRPIDAIASYDATLRRLTAEGSTSVRVAGEIPLGPTRSGWDDWMSYEAILNRAFADRPAHVLCVYDTNTAPETVLDAVWRTHPHVVADGDDVGPHYHDPHEILSALTPVPVRGLPLHSLPLVGDAIAFRENLSAGLRDAGAPEAKVVDMLVAANEVFENALRHGNGPTALRAGLVDGWFVCEIEDRGPGLDDPLAGYVPPAPGEAGPAGLWIARQLVSRLELIPAEPGLTVRLWL
ncbi:MAG: sensor histidine kinase [Actinomycetota bacterium]|nr:sensor histidine kinase [Actinomycetota bacterium]